MNIDDNDLVIICRSEYAYQSMDIWTIQWENV